METLRRIMTAACLGTIGWGDVTGQTDGGLQKAFSDSYAAEYNKKYADAVAVLMKAYSEKGYEVNLRLGWLHYVNGNYTVSQQYYEKAVVLKPYSVEARLGLAKPLAALESSDRLLKNYEDLLKIDPQNSTANYWSGVIHYNRKKYEAAARHFERIVNLYPFDYDGNHMLGWTYLNLGRNAEAGILFQKALLSRPGDASSLDGLSRIR
jgi:tetratricopeptide (TPR) repeat protein